MEFLLRSIAVVEIQNDWIFFATVSTTFLKGAKPFNHSQPSGSMIPTFTNPDPCAHKRVAGVGIEPTRTEDYETSLAPCVPASPPRPIQYIQLSNIMPTIRTSR